MKQSTEEEKDRRFRDRAIAAGALTTGSGAFVAGQAVKKAAAEVGKTARSANSAIRKLEPEASAAIGEARQRIHEAGAPARVVATAKRAAKGKWSSFIGKIARAKKKVGFGRSVKGVRYFRASEKEKGVMIIDGAEVSIPKLERVIAKKRVHQIPFSKVKGIERTKGVTASRLSGAKNALEKPGIVLGDGTIIDGRHRSRGRMEAGETHGVYRKASKKDLLAARLSEGLMTNLVALEATLDAVLFARTKQQIINDRGQYLDPIRAAAGLDDAYTPTEAGLRKVDIPIGHAQVLRAGYQKGRKINKVVQRVGRLAKDAGGAITGKPRQKDSAGRPKKREWEKSWFKNAVGSAVTGAAIIGGAAAMKKNYKVPVPRKGAIEEILTKRRLPGKGDFRKQGIRDVVTDVSRNAKKRANKALPDLFPTQSFSVPITDERGRQVFRVSDIRGTSARIHGGDKPARDRREKRWHEKIDNERKLRNAGTVAAAGAGLLIGANGKKILKKAASMIPKRAPRAVAANVVPFKATRSAAS
jgi:hypothetical protein